MTVAAADTTIRRPALRYFGGKWRLAPWIIEHFPPHICYVEPFGGAGSVLLRKVASKFEYLNDLDGEVANFFQVLRDNTEAFLRQIELTPFSRAELRKSLEPAQDPLERARRLYVRAWQARGGPRAMWNTGWRYQVRDARGKRAADDWNDIDHLWAIADRLKRVSLECDDFTACLRRYDSPETLFYVDPPYLAETRCRRWLDKAYFCDFNTEAQHAQLAAELHKLQGMVVLSGYPSAVYRLLVEARGWLRKERRAKTDTGFAVEALWLNDAAVRGRARQLEIFG